MLGVREVRTERPRAPAGQNTRTELDIWKSVSSRNVVTLRGGSSGEPLSEFGVAVPRIDAFQVERP